ncbi:MAG: hypothetical protein ACI959_002170 [Limisphaerales bacterium]|jgi:hypothetical protein
MSDSKYNTIQSNLLKGTRIYLSGPMDFVASREDEKKYGWRNRISSWLQARGAIVFDPWNKPEVRGLEGYGNEDEQSTSPREIWSFEDNEEGAGRRARCAEHFWPIMHMDLRMVDIADFVIAFCPTNIYSVGTPHEIVVARQQHKPVLFVSPPVEYSALGKLENALADRPEELKLLQELKLKVPIKENPRGIPSLWYMPLLNSEHFFDGFGFGLEEYQQELNWDEPNERDTNEKNKSYARPLLPFLARMVAGEAPPKWDRKKNEYRPDDNWLLLDLGNTGT